MLSLQFNHVSKRYRVGRGLLNIRELLSSWWKSQTDKYHWAVENVSFELHSGGALGIIGPNGAGKTTILKLLSKVTYPTSGDIQVNGRLSALIELGAGFHPDLTGRENIFLNGTILGMPRSEIKARFDSIVEFAGIGKYLDTPVKRYSSGMYARLGFAIAAHVDPEVLLVDEVLAVGDHAFQMKCYARMEELRAQGTALILVSHNMDVVRRVCEQGLVMYGGRAIFQGTASEAVVAYSKALRQAAHERLVETPMEEGLSQRVMTFDAEIEDVKLLNEDGQTVSVLSSGANASLALDIIFKKEVIHPIVSFFIYTEDGYLIYNTTTNWMKIETPVFFGGERCRVVFTIAVPLLEGQYLLGADIASQDLSHYYDRIERALDFAVKGNDQARGLVDLRSKVIFINSTSIGAEK